VSDRARDHLTPVWSGFSATDVEGMPMDDVPEPTRGAGKFQVSNPDPVAQARFAAALEEIASVGVRAINARIAERVSAIIDLADEFALPVTSPRAEAERAGIVVLQPEQDRLTVLEASLHNHGITATTRGGSTRLSAHATTGIDTLAMLKSAFIAYATAAS
jgi:kynureninase